VIERAKSILHQLEFGQSPTGKTPAPDKKVKVDDDDGMIQLNLFEGLSHPVLDRLKELDVNALTPLEALTLLNELSQQAK
jgi:DNA mismatch repair protein MutS